MLLGYVKLKNFVQNISFLEKNKNASRPLVDRILESASRGGGCLLGGLSAPGGMSTPGGGCLLLGGVSARGVSAPGGVTAPRGCLLPEVCVCVSQHALRQTPPC